MHETLPQSGNQDSFRPIFKISASMFQNLSSQLIRITTGIL